MWQYTNSDELYHHGVKGMKWGVRKARKTLSDIVQPKIDGAPREHKKIFPPLTDGVPREHKKIIQPTYASNRKHRKTEYNRAKQELEQTLNKPYRKATPGEKNAFWYSDSNKHRGVDGKPIDFDAAREEMSRREVSRMLAKGVGALALGTGAVVAYATIGKKYLP